MANACQWTVLGRRFNKAGLGILQSQITNLANLRICTIAHLFCSPVSFRTIVLSRLKKIKSGSVFFWLLQMLQTGENFLSIAAAIICRLNLFLLEMMWKNDDDGPHPISSSQKRTKCTAQIVTFLHLQYMSNRFPISLLLLPYFSQ